MFLLQNYSKEDASISDPDNKVTLKFLHDLDTNHCDEKSRPGSDLSSYLRGLRSRKNRSVLLVSMDMSSFKLVHDTCLQRSVGLKVY